ncbi:MAG: polysaccharide biosynthesis tyrosine autokinase [Bacteroidetes bacterium]|nr:polysaccharide biosynthesis tyrosine autokinase [Bacteroidota bacterium]
MLIRSAPLSILPTKTTYLRAVDVLNEIGQVYINKELEDKIKEANTTLAFIEEQLLATNDELNTVEKNFADYRQRTQSLNLGEQSKNLLGQLQETDLQLRQSDVKIKSLETLEGFVKKNSDFSVVTPSSFGIDEPLLVDLINDYRNLQLKRRSLSVGGTGKVTPQVQIVDEQMESTKAAMLETIKSIRNQASIADASIKDQLQKYERNAQQIPEQEREFMNLQRKQDVNSKMYLYLLQKKQATDIQLSTMKPDNRVLDDAVVSDKPVAPKKILIAIIAALLGFIFPSTLVFFQNVFKSTVSSRDDIDTNTNIPVLGVIGMKEGGDTKRSLYVYDNPKSVVAECLRSIRTNIQLSDPDGKNQVILITSTIAGEGKTFMSLNLATVFAMQNYKTAILGFDLRKPRLHKEFNLDNDIGITNYLRGQCSFEEIVQETHIKNLHLYTAGPIPDNPSELLSGGPMQQLFEKLRANYDYVFVDTPPIGVLSDGFVLMHYSDMNVYVIRENFSKKEFLATLEELRKENKVPNMHILLNAADLDKGYGNYGHYHGYNSKYKYYSDNEKRPSFFKRLFRK